MIFVGADGPIAGKPAPTEISCVAQIVIPPENTVGAGLLAMGPARTASMPDQFVV